MKTIHHSKILLPLVLFFVVLLLSCEPITKEIYAKVYTDSINKLRAENYTKLVDSTISRFNKTEIEHFIQKKPSYFQPNMDYLVEANFVLDTSTPVFQQPTTTDRKPNYRIFGYVDFLVKDTLQKLTVYQNYDYKDDPEYGRFLFIPFMDNTNELSTYGGGRYLDILIPKSAKILLDFNTAFNPYCAYADRWSCPLVPNVNKLDVAIFAGEKKYK